MMKQIPLTQGKFALVDDEDYDFIIQWKWYYNTGYAVRGANPKIMMHRVINKTPERLDTDHINENKLDNTRKNLRSATRTQNQMNKGKQKNNTSGIRGVSWHKNIKAWSVVIRLGGKSVHAGYFDNIDDAKKSYEKLANFFHGDFAKKNYGGVLSR